MSGLKSQLGYVLLIPNSTSRSNIIHYSSARCHRATVYDPVSQLHALLFGCDHSYSFRLLIDHIVRRGVELHTSVDRKTVFAIIEKDGQKNERPLQIYINALEEMYENRELIMLDWIAGGRNPSEGLTKQHTGTTTVLKTYTCSNIQNC